MTIPALRARYTLYLCLLGSLTPPLFVSATIFFVATLVASIVTVSTHLGGSLETFETIGMPAFSVAFPSAAVTVGLLILWGVVYYKAEAAALTLRRPFAIQIDRPFEAVDCSVAC